MSDLLGSPEIIEELAIANYEIAREHKNIAESVAYNMQLKDENDSLIILRNRLDGYDEKFNNIYKIIQTNIDENCDRILSVSIYLEEREKVLNELVKTRDDLLEYEIEHDKLKSIGFFEGFDFI